MAKAAHIDFMEDVTHFAAFGFMVQKNMLELEDARKKIAELELKIELMQNEPFPCKECDGKKCWNEEPPTVENLKEMARFLVDTEDDIMSINIEVTYKKDEKEDKSVDSDDSE